jgi:hypothetical protein
VDEETDVELIQNTNSRVIQRCQVFAGIVAEISDFDLSPSGLFKYGKPCFAY